MNILDISLYNDKFNSSTPSTIPLNLIYSNKDLAFPEYSRVSDYLSMRVLHSDMGITLTTQTPTSLPYTTVTCTIPL